jgi:hypothetical protein
MNSLSRRVVVASVGSLLVGSLAWGITDPAAAYVRARPSARPANVENARTGVGNRNVAANRNVNVNVSANANRNVNVNDSRGYHGAGCCYDQWGHPVAAAVAVTATAVAVGTVATSLPASGCSAISVGGVAYEKCGPNYYQPQVQNGTIQYVVVNPPQ